jgi:DNA-binding NtrC family response regulator
MKVLVVDDEKIKRITLRDDLREANYDAIAVESAAIALQLLQNQHFDVLVTDLRMPKMHGIEFLKRVKKAYPHITVIIMTAYASVETAVEAMKFGAYNYIKKPFSSEELMLMLEKLKMLRSDQNFSCVETHREHESPYYKLIGRSQTIREIRDLLEKIADAQSAVLIYGEAGTGKELLAKSIHFNSAYRHRPFVALNCAELSGERLKQALSPPERENCPCGTTFSVEDTASPSPRGTLFLKEIDKLPLSLQATLLRVLEEQQLNREESSAVGRAKSHRIIAATKKNLRENVQNGAFREDLFYRLNVVPIFLPPLRERTEDIPLLVNHFLDVFSPNRPIHIVSEALDLLKKYPWPGNVRELENVVERLTTVGGGKDITAEDIPLDIKLPTHISLNETLNEISFHEIIHSTERELIAWAMKKAEGNKTQAAKLLKMKPSTFRDALAKHVDAINAE